jgi:two-component system, sensor histidine kinase and response regulator
MAGAVMTPTTRPPPLVLIVHRPGGVEKYGDYLAGSGFRVAEACGGSQGVERALLLLPDLIVLDFELDGEVVGLLREYPTTRKIPVIALAEMDKLRDRRNLEH